MRKKDYKKNPVNPSVKRFLTNAILLTLATVLVSVFMPSWGIPQIIVVILMGIISTFQWFIVFFFSKK